MCMRYVYGIYKGITPGMVTRFKGFMRTEEGKLYPLFKYNLDRDPLPLGQWLDEKDYRPAGYRDKIRSYSGITYPTGWHVYVDEDRANIVASIVTEHSDFLGFDRGVVLKVYCKGLLADGEDTYGAMNEVYRYIKIEKEEVI